MKKNGIALIVEERIEQIRKHGFDANRDAQYTNDELVDAAMQYIGGDVISCWPDTWDKKWYKPGDRIEELKRAGAMIAAEIDRIQGTDGSDFSIEVTQFDSQIPVKMNGTLIGHWRMLSVRGNLLVDPAFIPLGSEVVNAEQ